ncbi:immunity protein Imm33 domain-containing protein [Gordonia alkaliphila]|uniref:Immunity protein Imm33 domain-containing protein n=1 Tax=Gordonia alkaliphila TaxID=1053547 RepID=A0ABP8YWI1_9ACTN
MTAENTENATCHVSQRILADGRPVGYMVRDELGWSFLAGDETQEYVDDPANLPVVALHDLLERDPWIAAHLQAPVGTALVRTATGFAVESAPPTSPMPPPSPVPPGLHPDYPVAQGHTQLSEHWSLTLPQPMNRRMEDGALVLWRPGLTLWLTLWDLPDGSSPAEYVDRLPAESAERRFDVRRWRYQNAQYVGYRLAEEAPDARVPALYGIAAADGGVLHLAAYFDAESTMGEAGTILASARNGALC